LEEDGIQRDGGAIMAELAEVVKRHPRDFGKDVIIVAEYNKSGNIREWRRNLT